MILIISNDQDEHAKAVIRELTAQQRNDFRILDLSEFPLHMDMRTRMGAGKSEFALKFKDGTHVSMADVTAVWWRRPQQFRLAHMSNPTHAQFALSEAATAFSGVWQTSTALWVNDPVFDAAAAHKVWQLELARRIGLSIPETLITNSPEQAREFWKQYPGKVVYKAFSATYYAWRETRILRPEEEALAESIRLAPVIFQRYIECVADLRITIIGNEVFAAGADCRSSSYPVDVRFNPDLRYLPHELPGVIVNKLRTLMRQLKLQYGAIDMRLTPEGEYVFLEINPAGQFLYIEMLTGLKISAAMARLLSEGQSRNQKEPMGKA